MERYIHYLKWDDTTIGTIDSSYAVKFLLPNYNDIVSLSTHGKNEWTSEEFSSFLSGRIISRDRRDIERILFRCGLSYYDVIKIAKITRAIHPKDLLWIANDEDELLNDVITDVFASVFYQKLDLTGDSIDTPEGYNIKRYGVYNGKYGIYKQRISPLMTDVESEVAVYLLAKKMGIPCCPAYRADEKTVFSVFLYDFREEYVVHFRRLFAGARSDNEYQNLITARPQYKESIIQMIILDFITRQDDRHLSNVAVKVSGAGESFYPLYDNGRSLFYEDTEQIVDDAVNDPENYATTFGYAGTYWDFVKEIADEGIEVRNLVNLDFGEDEVAEILNIAGFEEYRFKGALAWIMKTTQMVKDLGNS